MQIRLLPNVSDPFPEKIVRERLTGSSAFYGERLRDIVWGTGERSLLKKLRKTFMRGMGMDIVCENPIASQCGSVQYMRRSFASGWTEPSAFYGERVRDIVSCAVVGYSTYYTILRMER